MWCLSVFYYNFYNFKNLCLFVNINTKTIIMMPPIVRADNRIDEGV